MPKDDGIKEFLGNLAVPLHILGSDGTILRANKAELELLGYPPEEYIGRNVGDFHADRDTFVEILARLAKEEPLSSHPARLLAKDGSIRHVELTSNGRFRDGEFVAAGCPSLGFAEKLADEHHKEGRKGELTGTVNLLVDVTRQRESEEAEARLAAIVASSNDAIVSKTLDGIVTSWNAGAARLFGFRPNEIVGQSITRIIPSELRDEEKEILAKLGRGERIEHYDTVRVAKDGRRVDVSLSISPVRDRSGKLVGAAKVARDVTQRKKLEETQRLLMQELNHRVKNTLAIVQAIASQTLRSTASPVEFVASFGGRIHALALTHDLLTKANWQGARLSAIIQAQTHADMDERISCAGPEIMLPPQLVSTLSLVFHELATNARKHGTLLAAHGQVLVEWAIVLAPVPSLQLRWIETGGPPLDMEAKPNPHFGTLLIERSIRSIAGGKANMRKETHGVVWEMALSLPQSSIAI